MKSGNIALSILFITLLTGMVLVNTELRAVYYEIDLTDKLRNYLSATMEEYSILKISGSNGYPIEIQQSEQEEVKILRSRLPQVDYRIDGDTLIVYFSGASVSLSAAISSTTPPGIIISVSKLTEIILENTHNRISGFDQQALHLQLTGSSYTELLDNNFGRFSLEARTASRFEFKNENTADTALFSLLGGSVGFLEGLSYHAFEPVLEDSSLIVLSKTALQELMHTP